MTELYIFDLDNTLTDRYGRTLMPQVRYWLEQQRPQRVAVATNQGGVGLHYWMERDGFGEPEKFPTEAEARERVAHVAQQIRDITGGEVLTYIAFRYLSKRGEWSPVPPGHEDNPEWSQAWRKPAPGMLVQAMRDFGVTPADCPLCVFIGDSFAGDGDRLAAEAAGIAYFDQADWFSQALTLHYPRNFPVDWLTPAQRVGLDLEKTLERFEEKLRQVVTSWGYVNAVFFERESDTADFALEPWEAAEAVTEPNIVARLIADLDINRHWLVYESPQDHAEALVGHPQMRYALMPDLMEAYDLDAETAARIIREARAAVGDG